MQSKGPESTDIERIKLLEKIHMVESSGDTDSGTSKALHDLKSRYNQLIEANLQCPNYLEYFPNEIWTQVFLRVAEGDSANILPLMQVCQRWTSIIVSEPRVWTSIYIRSSIESLELAYSALCLSKGFPLDVTIEVPMDPNIQRTFLQSDAHRIQYLQLKPLSGHFPSRNNEGNERLIKVGANVLKDLGPLPSLHSLTIHTFPNRNVNWSPIFVNLDAPQIRYIEGAVFPQDVLAKSRYTQLQDLVTSTPLEVILPELIKFSDLRRLSLFAQPKLEESTSPMVSSVDPCKDIALLRSLEYHQEYSDLIWPLLKHVGSSLRVLELSTEWEQLLKLFDVIQDARYLRELSLSIPLSSTKGRLGGNRGKAPVLSQVQIFVLEITEEDVGGAFFEISPYAEAARLVLEVLDFNLPHVRTLHLRSYIYTSDLIRLVQTMQHLNLLHLTSIIRSNRDEKTTCPALKTLRTGDLNVLRYLRMPNLTSINLPSLSTAGIEGVANLPFDLSFASTTQSIAMHCKTASIILANGSEFTQLYTLEWFTYNGGYDYRNGSFPSLTNIIFSDRSAHQGATAFCESLLRCPQLCPHLKTICFRRYPEWDILLYMLLRRNVLPGRDNISSITRIEIPGFPSPCILSPLSALLLGKLPLEMPSPKELSFMEIEDTFFDYTMYAKFTFTDVHKSTALTEGLIN
jgi:hypothetical protein